MSKIGLDAVTLGHRDIQSGIQSLSEYIKQIKIPVLCVNCDISYVPELHNIPNFKKWEIFRFPNKNLSVAVIGFVSDVASYACNLNEMKLVPLYETLK